MCTGVLVYALFSLIPFLETVGTTMGPLMESLLPLLMFLVLFVTFCKVDLHKMRPVWWHLWVTVANLILVALIMAVLLLSDGAATGPYKVLFESLLLCVIAPCATAAAVVTQKLGGSLEQTTTFTFISNLIAALIVPACFPLIEKEADVTFLQAFTAILYPVAALMVLPMVLAYVVKHRLHRLHRFIISTRDLSFYLWAVSLMIVTGITVKNIVHAQASILLLSAIALLAMMVCVLQFAVGRYLGRFSDHAQEAGQALGQKNTSVAIWLATAYLNPLSSVGPGCYILWQNIVNSVEIWRR